MTATVQPALDGSVPAPAITRRIVDDYEAWVDEVTPAYVEAADTGRPFTIDAVARDKKLPDPPVPKTQWGSLPAHLLNAGIIRHHGYGGSARAKQSLVHIWIGVPEADREAVAQRRRDERAAARAEKRAA
ncbi:hypothetical protein [Streptomyces sp. NPDC059916]|uniref:hypothetical protein n=1 Tax=Streptomyces sp. NPDC059916 TaxID=3347001 RepID=UPI0036A6D8E8